MSGACSRPRTASAMRSRRSAVITPSQRRAKLRLDLRIGDLVGETDALFRFHVVPSVNLIRTRVRSLSFADPVEAFLHMHPDPRDQRPDVVGIDADGGYCGTIAAPSRRPRRRVAMFICAPIGVSGRSTATRRGGRRRAARRPRCARSARPRAAAASATSKIARRAARGAAHRRIRLDHDPLDLPALAEAVGDLARVGVVALAEHGQRKPPYSARTRA